MGTPEFAVPSLEILVQNGFEVVAVITAPDKPRGRGRKPAPSAVKESAMRLGIPVLQPVNLKDPAFQDHLRSLHIDLQIVVAFRMLPEAVWNMPPLGTFNLHASLLPQYRGAAPIHWAVINGETKTGVTTFFLRHEIDTGEIIFQEEIPIGQDDTTGEIYEKLMKRGADLVLKTVSAIQTGDYPRISQAATGTLKEAPKLYRETCEINWDQPSAKIHNFIRGLNPFPGAWTMVDGQMVKIFRVSQANQTTALSPGAFDSDHKTWLRVGTGDGILSIDELQWQGKRRMSTTEFLRGNEITV